MISSCTVLWLADGEVRGWCYGVNIIGPGAQEGWGSVLTLKIMQQLTSSIWRVLFTSVKQLRKRASNNVIYLKQDVGEEPVPGWPHRVLFGCVSAEVALLASFRLKKQGGHDCRDCPTEVLNKSSLSDLWYALLLLIALNLKFYRKLLVIRWAVLLYLIFFFIAFHNYLKLVLSFSYLLVHIISSQW